MHGFQNFCLIYAQYFNENLILIYFQFNLKYISIFNTYERNEVFIEKK